MAPITSSKSSSSKISKQNDTSRKYGIRQELTLDEYKQKKKNARYRNYCRKVQKLRKNQSKDTEKIKNPTADTAPDQTHNKTTQKNSKPIDNSDEDNFTLALHTDEDTSSEDQKLNPKEEARIQEMREAVKWKPKVRTVVKSNDTFDRKEFENRKMNLRIKELENENLRLTLDFKRETRAKLAYREQLEDEQKKSKKLEDKIEDLDQEKKEWKMKAIKGKNYKAGYERLMANYFDDRTRVLRICEDTADLTGDSLKNICNVGKASIEVDDTTRVLKDELDKFAQGKLDSLRFFDQDLEEVCYSRP